MLGEGSTSWDLFFAGLGVVGVLMFALEVGDLDGDSGGCGWNTKGVDFADAAEK